MSCPACCVTPAPIACGIDELSSSLITNLSQLRLRKLKADENIFSYEHWPCICCLLEHTTNELIAPVEMSTGVPEYHILGPCVEADKLLIGHIFSSFTRLDVLNKELGAALDFGEHRFQEYQERDVEVVQDVEYAGKGAFMAGIRAEAVGSRRQKMSLIAPFLTTRWIEATPEDYTTAVERSARVRDFWEKFPNRPVYMVTGMKTCEEKTIYATTGNTQGLKANVEMGASGVSVGPMCSLVRTVATVQKGTRQKASIVAIRVSILRQNRRSGIFALSRGPEVVGAPDGHGQLVEASTLGRGTRPLDFEVVGQTSALDEIDTERVTTLLDTVWIKPEGV